MAVSEFGYDFVLDLEDRENNGINYFTRYNVNNGEREEVMSVALDAEGPHGRYNMCDTIMCKMPTGVTVDEAFKMCHMHNYGYETFFVDSGLMHLYVDGKVCMVKTGDIIQLQAGQVHAMASEEDVKWRGWFHDLDSFHNGIQAGKVAARLAKMGVPRDDPDFMAARMATGKDFYLCEPPVYEEIPVEEMMAVRHPDRPLAQFDFKGFSIRQITRRCENAGVSELILCRMEPGFSFSYGYHKLREQYYVRTGKVKLELFGDEYIVTGGSIINIPILAPFKITAIEQSDVYDINGQANWFPFFLNLESIRKKAPERLDDPETIKFLKEHFNVETESISTDLK